MVFLWQDLAADERVVAAWEPRPALGAPAGLSLRGVGTNAAGSTL